MNTKSFMLFILLIASTNIFAQWSLTGNNGTTPGTNFIGTIDIKDLVFKRNNFKSGFIGEYVTGFGFKSLSNNTGTFNSAFGSYSMYSNTTGGSNSAFGSHAMYSNVSGASNSAFGFQSLFSNNSGSFNAAFGYNALYYNTNGAGNTAMGYAALQNSTGGSDNTATGYNSLKSNTGSSNSAFGSTSLFLNISGLANTAIGRSSLENNSSGSNNTAVGYRALHANLSGSNNTILGYNTGLGITTGSGNTILGANVNGLSGSLSNSIILADGSGNQRIFVNQDGNVGVGTNTLMSNVKLMVEGSIYSNGKILINSDLTHAGNFSLAVNGEAIFNRAVVRLYGTWPDYVFDKSYNLEPLEEVEKFILQNKHLKGIKNSAEVKEEGIDIAENQKMMLQKIEELTLYIIGQNKTLNNLQKKIDLLSKNSNQ